MIAKSGICFALARDPVEHTPEEATRRTRLPEERNPFDIGLSRESCDIGRKNWRIAA
jgi:hypothetical protein